MSQGLYAAISGIKADQSMLDVVSNNIANMNTVGFKSSLVNFQNIFSKTLSSGSAPSNSLGGTNPMQIGLGVTIGEITTNFNSGPVQTTGRSTDLNIQGNGFFTIMNPNGGMYLTRAGNFSLDADGYLVNPQGLKVLGSSGTTGVGNSSIPVQVPVSLDVTRNPASATTTVTNTINSSGTPMTEGTFDLTLNGVTHTINTTGKTLQDIIVEINGDPGPPIPALDFGGENILASINPVTGIFSIENTGSADLTITPGTSNFLSVTGLSSTIATGVTSNSDALRDDGNVTIGTSTNGANTVTYNSISISNSGTIEASYSNGDKITVDSSGAIQVKTAAGNILTGSAVTVNGGAVQANNLQLQMSDVVNPQGLISSGGNLYTVGPNAGNQTFGIGGEDGIGSINSGSLEGSNVDITSEFANMIIAQRCIDANSKAFSAQNQVLQRIVNMVR